MTSKSLIATGRFLWRQRLFTALNIIGLAISISACWIIYRIVDYEFSYEKKVPGSAGIYRLVSGFVFDEKESYNGGVPKPVYQGIREQLADVQLAVPVFGEYLKSVEVNVPNAGPLVFEEQDGVVSTDASYFSLVPYHWLAGSAANALHDPNTVVLTAKRAAAYFPGKKPEAMLNQVITYYSFRDTIQRTVTGIVEPAFEGPTEFTYSEFCTLPGKPYQLVQWTNTNGSDKLYLQLKPSANAAAVEKQVNELALQKRKAFHENQANSFKYRSWHNLVPLTAMHFTTHIDEWAGGNTLRKANKKILFGLVGIGAFLLLLACINYINMSVASLPQRSREIGVRKTLGSSRSELIAQFLLETMMTALLAGLFSFVLSKLGFWLLAGIIPAGITLFGNILQPAGFVLVVALLTALLAGIYPAWLITRVKAVDVFRSTSLRAKHRIGFSLQKALIVFQFTIALVFIIGALITGRQLHYVLKTDMGFNKEAVLLADVPWKLSSDEKYAGKQFALQTALKAIPGIQQVALGTAPLSDNYSSSEYEYTTDGREPVKKQVFKKWIDSSYMELYGIQLLAGRKLHPSDTTNELVINEAAVKGFGFRSPQDALGKLIGPGDQKFPVVGVVKDFHTQNFYTSIDPMAFESEKSNLNAFNIKLGADPSQWQKTIEAIRSAWNQFYPANSFEPKFYDETIEAMYQQERQLSKLVDLATVISVLISCLGLFGLAVLTAHQRTKEIGIRKVLGASVTGIVRMLSKEYVVLVLVALLIASPIAWWAMNSWLQQFTYRISIHWWMFAMAGLVALLLALVTVSFEAVKSAMANPVKSLRTE